MWCIIKSTALDQLNIVAKNVEADSKQTFGAKKTYYVQKNQKIEKQIGCHKEAKPNPLSRILHTEVNCFFKKSKT